MKIDTARRRLRGNLKPNRFGISCEDERDRKDVGKYTLQYYGEIIIVSVWFFRRKFSNKSIFC